MAETAEPSDGNDPREELLKTISSRTNRAILSLLAVEPTYPRKIGNLLSISEGEAARRLKHMEGLGLVSSAWSYVGKNIKLYRLAADRIQLAFKSDGVHVELANATARSSQNFTLLPFPMHVPMTDTFLGRTKELARLNGPERAVLVEGMPGVGKTALVAQYARNFGGGRALFWHSFRGLESLAWLANRFAVFLAQQGDSTLLHAVEQRADLSDARELMLRGMDNERFIVVFDDVHRIEDGKVREFLTDAINRTQRAKLIVTGRETPRYDPSLPGRLVLRLQGFTDAEVAQFFDQRKVPIDPALLPKVREEVGGHPLALNLLLEAANELKVPVPKLLDRIPERNIEEYLLNEVVGSLSEDERQLLTQASVFRGRFSAEDLAALSKRTVDHALFKLRRRQLVKSDGTDYSLHEVIRNFFYKALKDREALHLRAAQRYLERQTIDGRLEAMHHFLLAGKRDRVLVLLEENLDYKEFDYIDAGYQNLYLSILDQFQKNEVSDPRRWALILDEKGDITLHRGEPARALEFYGEAQGLFEKAKDTDRILDLLWKRGLALEVQGKSDDARALAEEGLARAAKDGTAKQRLEELLGRLKDARKPKASMREPAARA